MSQIVAKYVTEIDGISYYCTFSFTEQNLPNNGKKRAEKLKFLIKKVHSWSQSVPPSVPPSKFEVKSL
jgi:hypothetical protein